ncbi:hypothetical protein SISNIDRAFT_481526 [Sistotremastrum niveocremeum HHB9708]|uniref:Yeast cell wall synthesis Kre9/Knh1-like N-terminal domain-containing protein n=2 Tax=Sistotremastraceae TaxID=3402574 RepID=A0A164ZCR3_9AGAM|nr:hypothetical protein SISNIDRAFT_481526 [Sistotremastrum niveocremeum HHB9708]KZT39643.1 hypothetical protein SISSUDRAFT_623712 [Sistotremastrum suecicum HHB10207 ss-3]
MFSSLLVVAAAALSAVAYQVTSPTAQTIWFSHSPNVVSWVRVVTDPQNFSMILVNQDPHILPSGLQGLIGFVDGVDNTSYVVPVPSNGFPVGTGFQVNLIANASDTNFILAQSPMFNITAGTGPSTSTTGTGSVTLISGTGSTIIATQTPTVTFPSSSSSSEDSDATNTGNPNVPSQSSAASPLGRDAYFLPAVVMMFLGITLA